MRSSLLLCLGMTACTAQGGTVSMSLVVNGSAGGTGTMSAGLGTDSLGANTTAGLKSLKYLIYEIGICDTKGSSSTGGFNANSSGCLALYKSPTARPSGPQMPNADAANNVRFSAASYGVDLMDANARAALSSQITLTDNDVRSYQYGYVYWNYPIVIDAELTAAGASSVLLYTHSGAAAPFGNSGPSGDQFFTTQTDPVKLTDNPGTASVVLLPNGGANFEFQRPLTITHDDISKKTSYALDLTFNPDGIIQGATNQMMSYGTISDRSGNIIMVPMLNLTPIAHPADQQVVKETYTATLAWTNPAGMGGAMDSHDVRVEIYSLSKDTQTVYGGSYTPLVNANTQYVPDQTTNNVGAAQTASDGTLTLLHTSGDPMVSGFVRKTKVGDTTTATIACGSIFSAYPGCPAGSSVQATFTLQGSHAL